MTAEERIEKFRNGFESSETHKPVAINRALFDSRGMFFFFLRTHQERRSYKPRS